jgi:acyl carrier protein
MIDTLTVKEQMKEFIVKTSFVDPEKVKDDTLIFTEGIFDSMGFLALINFVEENFNIKAEDAELLEENFESVDAIAGYIQKKLA